MGSAASREAGAAQQPQLQALPGACAASASAGAAALASQPGCPVPEEVRRSPGVYNVYNQRIDGAEAQQQQQQQQQRAGGDQLDPRNNMPLAPAQRPWPGQRALLPTERAASTIPKGGTSSTWTYPSPQMFFNALQRKGKGADVTEEDMGAVVAAHNTLNELTWAHVAGWEALRRAECGAPALLRFLGRPDDLSPAARWRALAGDGRRPFDRHDWYVDRCGREVRYVVDFYFDDAKAGSPQAFEVVARPALDSVDAALDRLKVRVYRFCAAYGLPCPVTGHNPGQHQQEHHQQQQQAG
jgi:cytochrome c heme-lyase